MAMNSLVLLALVALAGQISSCLSRQQTTFRADRSVQEYYWPDTFPPEPDAPPPRSIRFRRRSPRQPPAPDAPDAPDAPWEAPPEPDTPPPPPSRRRSPPRSPLRSPPRSPSPRRSPITAPLPDPAPSPKPTPAPSPSRPRGNTPRGASNYQVLPEPANVVAVHLVHIPGTSSYLFMERPSGNKPDRSRQIAGSYDLDTQEWTHIEARDGLFCAGHTLTADGQVLIVGGHKENAGWISGMKSVRLYHPRIDRYNLRHQGFMNSNRWYPTATLLPNGKVVVMGGTQDVGAGTPNNKQYEIWDPRGGFPLEQLPVDPGYLEAVKQNYYPFNYVMPTGDMFMYCGRSGWIFDAETADYKEPIPAHNGYATMQFPSTGTSVLLGLYPEKDYRFEVMVFGGNMERAPDDGNTLAGRHSYRMRVEYGGSRYSFSSWQEEDMGYRRVMGDATILPNGCIIIQNGAERGLAGDAATGGINRASYPTFAAVMYNPDAPVGSRYTTLASSTIARLYHSTAALTVDGTIFVSGCDRCARIITDEPGYEPPPHRSEYRNEIFYPPFYYESNKPDVQTINGMSGEGSSIPQVRIGQTFTVTFSLSSNFGSGDISAVLMAPSSCTHSFNTNQRLVGLRVLSVDTLSRTLTLQAPPTGNHAPPQMYMLFVLNGMTYGRAKWVHIKP